MKDSISNSFIESIKKNTMSTLIDISEKGIDSFMSDGILKELPIMKYVVNTYNVIDDIKGRCFLRKLDIFIRSFNSGIATEEDIEKQKLKILKKNRNKELEYIMIIIDRYLDIDKPEILAKMYLAYLDKIITWDEFCAYSEITNTLLKIDIMYLIKNETVITKNNIIESELLRLTGNGLMFNYQNDSPFEENERGGFTIFSNSFERVKSKERIFSRTEFGKKFVDIINSY